MSTQVRDRLGPVGRYTVAFLAGMLVTALIALTVVVVWRQTTPITAPPAPASPSSGSSSPSPSIDANAGDDEHDHDHDHDHDTIEDEKPQWEPAVLGFAKNFTNTADDDSNKWRQRLAPYVVLAVRDQLADVDPAKVPAGRYDTYELLKTGNYQIAAKANYREGWALVLYVTSDGNTWKVTAYDKWEQ